MLPYIAVGAGAGGIAVLALGLYAWSKRRTMCSCLYVSSQQSNTPSHQTYPPRPPDDVELGTVNEHDEWGGIDYDQAMNEIDSNSGSPAIRDNPFMSNLTV